MFTFAGIGVHVQRNTHPGSPRDTLGTAGSRGRPPGYRPSVGRPRAKASGANPTLVTFTILVFCNVGVPSGSEGRGGHTEPVGQDSSNAGLGRPADSRLERGNERGKHGRGNRCKAIIMNALQDCSGHQHLNDHWDFEHPFERILVDTAVAPRSGVSDLDQPAGHVRRDASRADRHPRQDRRRLYARSGHRRVSLGTADVDARRSSAPSTAPQVTSSRTRSSSSAPKARTCSPAPPGSAAVQGRPAVSGPGSRRAPKEPHG